MMSIIKKLKGQETQPAPVVNPYACQKRNCDGVYIPVRIGIKNQNGTLTEICVRLVCSSCAQTKIKMIDGRRHLVVLAYGPFGWTGDILQFNVPRQYIEEPVFDRSGGAVLDEAGNQIYAYKPEKKKEFLRKLVSLVNLKSPAEQYFTPEQIESAP